MLKKISWYILCWFDKVIHQSDTLKRKSRKKKKLVSLWTNFFFFLEESFSNNDKGFIVTGKSSTYRFDDIGELPSMNMTMMHMESQ